MINFNVIPILRGWLKIIIIDIYVFRGIIFWGISRSLVFMRINENLTLLTRILVFAYKHILIIRIPRCSVSEVLEESLKTDGFHKMLKFSYIE
tara:strand:+ start:3612 stop:3890 length:279 start_codon:yes stop_codon:yes gene_type:complete